ncbi:MAG: hypothetical protein NC306_14600, partial [Butyrivibrio sp.]|nr:hypothetical protein [Butyrivibrio sp.]
FRGVSEMWRGDSGDARPMAGITVNEAHRNAYRAVTERCPCCPGSVPLSASRQAPSRLNCY